METESRTLYCPNINLNSAVWAFSAGYRIIHFHTDGRRFAVRFGSSLTMKQDVYAARAIAVLHRFSEGRGAVRGVGGGLPAALHEPERAQETRRAGDGDVVDVGRAQALRAYRGAARRRRVARASRHEQDRQRGRGSAAFTAIEEEAGANWLRGHLDHCAEPLLSEPWILDVDTTVKPLYGDQEGAVVGYNPRKPGRPSHCYHTYSMAGTRLVLEVDVSAGDEHSSNHSAPGLWALLDRTPRDCWPSLLRGDKGFGNEGVMGEAERRALPYVFKLRVTANVKRAIETPFGAERLGRFGPRLASQGDRDSIARLEPTTARRHIASARERRAGDARDGRGSTASARLPRHRPERGDVGISGSRNHARRGFGKLWRARSRPRRWRECFRRVEEPMGLGRLRHARPGALSSGRPPRGVVL